MSGFVSHWDSAVVSWATLFQQKLTSTKNSLGKGVYVTILQTTSPSALDILILQDLWITHHRGCVNVLFSLWNFPIPGQHKDLCYSPSSPTLLHTLSLKDSCSTPSTPKPPQYLRENKSVSFSPCPHTWHSATFPIRIHQGIQQNKGLSHEQKHPSRRVEVVFSQWLSSLSYLYMGNISTVES